MISSSLKVACHFLHDSCQASSASYLVRVSSEQGNVDSQEVEAWRHCYAMPTAASQVLSNGSLQGVAQGFVQQISDGTQSAQQLWLARFQSLKWFEMATFSWQAVGKPEYLKLDCITGLTARRSTIYSFVQHSTGEAACLWVMLLHVKSVQCCIHPHDDSNRYPA